MPGGWGGCSVSWFGRSLSVFWCFEVGLGKAVTKGYDEDASAGILATSLTLWRFGPRATYSPRLIPLYDNCRDRAALAESWCCVGNVVGQHHRS